MFRWVDHPLYRKWRVICNRCLNPKNPSYRYYGARGIVVCPRWRERGHGGANFIVDMEPTYFPGAWIERIDNDGPYSPENCRWATVFEQNRNKRSNVFVEYNGDKLCLADVAALTGLSADLLQSRRKKGWSGEKLFRPANCGDVETELGRMTMSDAVFIYEVNRSTVRQRLAKGKTWQTGLLDPPDAKFAVLSPRV